MSSFFSRTIGRWVINERRVTTRRVEPRTRSSVVRMTWMLTCADFWWRATRMRRRQWGSCTISSTSTLTPCMDQRYSLSEKFSRHCIGVHLYLYWIRNPSFRHWALNSNKLLKCMGLASSILGQLMHEWWDLKCKDIDLECHSNF